jgi:arabinan endo-1,5-alpha-L-arabinosidase
MKRNPNSIEAPVIIYNPAYQYYYLFFSTGWIDNSYHVRVGRSRTIRGPYYDDQNRPLVGFEDSGALVTAPYRFSDVDEPGWSGVGHADVLQHDGEYYILHNARVAGSSEWIHLNVRRIYWSSDGWPMAMPQRYAGEITQKIDRSALSGIWQVIYMDPEDDSVLAFRTEKAAVFESVRTLLYPESWQSLDENNHFLFEGFEVVVSPAWDWERGVPALQFSGRNKDGVVVWGVSR